jgi:general secretion pathway protein D
MIERNRGIGRFLLILLLVAGMSGCAKYQAKAVFDEAEELARAEQYDLAVEKYLVAVETDPSNMTYKIKLTAGRTRAAAFHIGVARNLAKAGKFEEALAEYRLARGFDPSLEVASIEEKQILQQVRARTLVEEGFTRYGEKRYPEARQIVAEVLQLDPQGPRGLELQALLDGRRQSTVIDGIELDIASDEPVTLRFRQTNVREAFAVLAKLSGINFILDEEARGKPITVLLEKGTFAQALELILQIGGVEKKVLNSKTILIYPNTKDKGKQYQDHVIQTFYLSHIDAKKAINMLRTMLQLRKVYVHEERNALVIRDTPDAIRLAEQILKAADRADSEVLFDVEVLAVREGDTLKFGPNLSTYGTAVGFSTSDTPPGNFPSDIVVQSLNNLQTFYTLPSAVFDFAKTLNSAEILASPKIRVKNNEKAKIHIGNRDPIVTTTILAGTDTTTQNVQYVDSGIKLDIEPNVQLDGSVLAKITLEVSSAQRLDSKDTKGTSPVALTTTNAQTALVLVDGVRTILGGLYEKNTTKNKTTFPFLGSIPLIGSLLTSFDNAATKREILLSITPYVVKRVEVPTPDIATIWSGGEDTLTDGPKFGAFAKPLLSDVEATRPGAAPGLKSAAPGRAIRPKDRRAAMDEGDDEDDATFEGAPPATPSGVPAEVLGAPVPEAEDVAVVPLPIIEPKTVGSVLILSGPPGVAVGEQFTVAVHINSVEQLFSAPLFVGYNADRLDLVEAKEGTFLGQSGKSTVFSVSPISDAGQVVVGYKLAEEGGGVSGSGMLFALTFRAKAPGDASISLNRLNFRDASGAQLEVAPATTIITVQ